MSTWERILVLRNQKYNNSGETPGDTLMVEREVTLSGSAGTVEVPFRGGEAIYYLLAKKATTAYDATDDRFEVSVSAAAIGATDTVVALLFGMSGAQQYTKPD
jgi:hypothetical protein